MGSSSGYSGSGAVFCLPGSLTGSTLSPTLIATSALASIGSGLDPSLSGNRLGFDPPFDWARLLLPECHVFLLLGVISRGSLMLLRRLKGLWFWKKPLFFFDILLSLLCAGGWDDMAASCLTGETLPLGGSRLEKEYSLRSSWLVGRSETDVALTWEPRSDPLWVFGRQSIVMPSIGYGS